jgi:hypothetical protein
MNSDGAGDVKLWAITFGMEGERNEKEQNKLARSIFDADSESRMVCANGLGPETKATP